MSVMQRKKTQCTVNIYIYCISAPKICPTLYILTLYTHKSRRTFMSCNKIIFFPSFIFLSKNFFKLTQSFD